MLFIKIPYFISVSTRVSEGALSVLTIGILLKIGLKWPFLAIFWYILVVFGVYGPLLGKGIKVVKYMIPP